MAVEINGNLKAFLQVIRHCEGTSGPNGYRTLFGGSLFDSFDDHPRKRITAKLKGTPITSSAAGAYQILEKTWDSLRKIHGRERFPDFTPETQDLAALELIRGRKALRDVEEGRFEAAINKCSWEWASLPPGRYGQPIKTLEECKRIYEQNGGVYMVAPIVVPVASAFITAAVTELAKQLPTLGKLFGSGSEVSNRNLAVAETVVNLVKDTIGASNAQEAVEMVKADPTVAKTADDAIKANAYEIFGVDLSGVGEARKFNIEVSEKYRFWEMPSFWISLLVLPLAYFTVWEVLRGPIEYFSVEVKASTASAVVSLVLGGVIGFWLGASYTTSKSRGLNATPVQNG